MPVTIDDLKPKTFTVTIKGLELTCKPPRMAQVLSFSKFADVLQNPKDYSTQDFKQTEKDLDVLIGELIPELKDVELGLSAVMDLLEQIMDNVQPDDNQELKKNNIQVDSDPKAKRSG